MTARKVAAKRLEVPKMVTETVADAKSLHVSFDENNVPSFAFEGFWVGKDVPLILRHLPRAYKYQKRDERRGVTK